MMSTLANGIRGMVRCLLLAVASASAVADPVPDLASLGALQARASDLQLHRHPAWQRLLHLDRDGRRSEVLSPEFFLSERGAEDPAAELQATLRALQLPVTGDGQQHATCRFPARHLWLASRLDLPTHDLPGRHCTALHQWARLDELMSVSLILVSGYFGNPASTFGHALLRFNTRTGAAAGGLMDLGINFGALVPENENTLVYVLKGLSGGYEAGFSDREYYAHDLVYTRTENRDMWNYELALQPEQQRLLVLHVWEVAAKKFRYYFLSDNCAYRLAEILELATGLPLRDRSSLWYSPVELFHRLDERARRAGRPWAGDIRFEPSGERVLRHQLAQLSAAERRAFDAMREAESADLSQPLRRLSVSGQMRALDALIAFQTWRGQTEAEQAPAGLKLARQRALQTRIALPPIDDDEAGVPSRPSPADGLPPMRWTVGLVAGQRAQPSLELGWAAFGYDLAGHHGLDGGELTLADVRLDAEPGRGLSLQRLVFIRVRKLNARRAALPDEDPWSWQMEAAVARENDDARNVGVLRPMFSFGMGLAVDVGSVRPFAMIDAAVHGRPTALSLSPGIGALWANGPWRALVESRWRHERGTAVPRAQTHLEINHRLKAAQVLRLRLDGGSRRRVAISWSLHP